MAFRLSPPGLLLARAFPHGKGNNFIIDLIQRIFHEVIAVQALECVFEDGGGELGGSMGEGYLL